MHWRCGSGEGQRRSHGLTKLGLSCPEQSQQDTFETCGYYPARKEKVDWACSPTLWVAEEYDKKKNGGKEAQGKDNSNDDE